MKKNSFILKKSFSFGSITLISRIFGLIRESVFANFFGTSIYADAFITAFTFPNLFRKLFGEGAFSGSFVPIFSDQFKKNRKKAWQLFNSTLTLLILFLTTATAIAVIILTLIQPHIHSARIMYIIELTKIMFPYVILVCSIGFLFGIFNFFGYYAMPAASSLLLNIIIILSLFGINSIIAGKHEQIKTLAWIILAGGIIQWFFFYPLIRSLKIPIKLSLKFNTPEFHSFFKLYIPSVFAVSIMQINILFDKIIAVFAGPSGPSILNYASRIYQLPLGIFGVSVALASLPEFSKSASNEEKQKLIDKLKYSIKLLLFISIPSALGLIALSKPIIRTIFERGAFSQNDTDATAIVLIIYAIGLFAFSTQKTITYAFYSLKDSVTPTKIATATVILNIILNIILVLIIGVSGIALATIISSAINVYILAKKLEEKTKEKIISFYLKTSLKYLLYSVPMALIAYAAHNAAYNNININSHLLKNAVSLAIGVCAGVIAYLLAIFIFDKKNLIKIFK